MKNKLLLIIVVFSSILAGCGKYDNGPFVSLRTKNNRLEGKWKLVEYKYELTDALDASGNESEILNGGTMTNTYYDVVFDPFTGEIIGYEPVYESYPFQQFFEFDIKKNTCETTTLSDGSSDISTSYWSWSDGSSEKEILEIDGQGLIINRLTNKELELSYEYKEDEVSLKVSIKMEKE